MVKGRFQIFPITTSDGHKTVIPVQKPGSFIQIGMSMEQGFFLPSSEGSNPSDPIVAFPTNKHPSVSAPRIILYPLSGVFCIPGNISQYVPDIPVRI